MNNPETPLPAVGAINTAEAMDVTPTIENNKESAKIEAPATKAASASTEEELPSNRFELELEFVQALASPNYLHFLATSTAEGASSSTTVLQDPAFIDFLKYLRRTWTQPAYARFLTYPHCLYFLELLIEKPAVMLKEWTLPQFRNFCHQQQFLCWQHRHASCYGRGTVEVAAVETTPVPESSPEKPDDTAQAAAAAPTGSGS